jgi:hypothetical protein
MFVEYNFMDSTDGGFVKAGKPNMNRDSKGDEVLAGRGSPLMAY